MKIYRQLFSRDRWRSAKLFPMVKKLTATNPYLRDPVVRARTVLANVATSSAIEGIRAPFKRDARSGAYSLMKRLSQKKR